MIYLILLLAYVTCLDIPSLWAEPKIPPTLPGVLSLFAIQASAVLLVCRSQASGESTELTDQIVAFTAANGVRIFALFLGYFFLIFTPISYLMHPSAPRDPGTIYIHQVLTDAPLYLIWALVVRRNLRWVAQIKR